MWSPPSKNFWLLSWFQISQNIPYKIKVFAHCKNLSISITITLLLFHTDKLQTFQHSSFAQKFPWKSEAKIAVTKKWGRNLTMSTRVLFSLWTMLLCCSCDGKMIGKGGIKIAMQSLSFFISFSWISTHWCLIKCASMAKNSKLILK